MTTREQIIAIADECFHLYSEWRIDIERFYAIAFEAGRVAEREENAQMIEDSDSDSIDPRDAAESIRARPQLS